MGSNDSGSVYASEKALKLILVANELLYLTIPREVDRVCRWWVANLVWVIHLVGFNVPHQSHVLNLLPRPDIHRQAFHLCNMGSDLSMNTGAIHAAGIECRSSRRGKGRTKYQMNIPRLWEAHRGFRVLQSAHISGSVGRNEGEASQRS